MGPYWKKLSNIVRTKWLFENKTVEKRVIARNKTHFVAQRYIQVEGIDFEEIFAFIARLESILMQSLSHVL